MLHPAWCAKGFGIEVSSVTTVTHLVWSDNIYIVAKNLGEWQVMFENLAHLLLSHGLSWKEKSVIVLEGGTSVCEEASWTLPAFPDLKIQKKQFMESIGSVIQFYGGDCKNISNVMKRKCSLLGPVKRFVVKTPRVENAFSAFECVCAFNHHALCWYVDMEEVLAGHPQCI